MDLPRHANRVTPYDSPGRQPWEPAGRRRRVYGSRVQSHDPYRAGSPARYLLPQLPGPDDPPLDPYTAPMRILAVVDRYPPLHNAGAEWMLHHLLRDTVRRGNEVVVSTDTAEEYRIEGVTVVPRRLKDEVAAEAQVAVGHLMWTRSAIETAGDHRLPLVYIVHNDRQLRHWNLMPVNVTATMWNSQWIANACAWWGGPSAIVRPPVLIDDYALPGDRWDAPFVTLVNPIEEKGSGVFYALADAPPARRYLAVEGAYGDQQLPGREHPNVEWQPQTGNMLADVYARTRVILVPSSYESWGRVALEAMAAGIPVVAHPTPGLLEALGPAGLFRDRTDLDGWRQALALLDDRDWYLEHSMRVRGHAAAMTVQAHQDFDTWDSMLRRCAALYEARADVPGLVKTHAVP